MLNVPWMNLTNDEPESITQNLWLSRGIAPGLTDLGT
jgi:hypothetical protein